MLRSLLAEGDVGVAEPESLGGLPSGDLFAVANAIAVAARRADHDRGPQLAGARLLRAARTRPTRRGSRRSSAARCPSATPGSSPSAASSATCYRSDRPVFVDPARRRRRRFSHAARRDRRPRRRRGARLDLGRGARAAQRRSGPRRCATPPSWSRCTCCGSGPAPTCSGGCAPTCVSTALEGGAGAREALERLGLAGQPLVVLGVAVSTSADGVRRADSAPSRTSGSGSATPSPMHLAAVHPRSAAALVGDVAYGTRCPLTGPARGRRGARRADRPRLPRPGRRPAAGRSSASARSPRDVAGLAHARAAAPTGCCGCCATAAATRRVARLADVQVEALMLELRDLVAARGDRPTGPLARLIDVRRASTTPTWSSTLRAWLDAFGDVVAAADVAVRPPEHVPLPAAPGRRGRARSTSPTPRRGSPRCSSCGCSVSTHAATPGSTRRVTLEA